MAISRLGLRDLREAALDTSSVGSISANRTSIHATYRYPARFSPGFAAAAINVFSEPGQLVLDPFCGGGTTGLEAIALGRHARMSDLSPLATFLATVRATPLSHEVEQSVRRWAHVATSLRVSELRERTADRTFDGYAMGELVESRYRHVMSALMAWEQLASLCGEAEGFARLCLLRCAQVSLDLVGQVPTLPRLRAALLRSTENTLAAASRFTDRVTDAWAGSAMTPVFECVTTSAADLRVPAREGQLKPSLAVFSPPYPGVHVLYARWQLGGRRETAAPFWLAGVHGDTTETRFTMGRRGARRTDEFVENYGQSASALSRVLAEGSYAVQMIGFLDPATQLPLVLKAMSSAGFREQRYASLATHDDGRLWRSVPSRRWYNRVRENSDSALPLATGKEVVLIHRLERKRDANDG